MALYPTATFLGLAYVAVAIVVAVFVFINAALADLFRRHRDPLNSTIICVSCSTDRRSLLTAERGATKHNQATHFLGS